MCYICRVRFLCSVYGLVHHCSARRPRALGPWRDVVLAPLSITPRLPEPRARCAGGGMCCSCGTPSPPRSLRLCACLHDGDASSRSHPSFEWRVESMCFCIWGLHPGATSVGPLFSEAPVLLITGGDQVIIAQTRGKTRLVKVPPGAAHPCSDTRGRAIKKTWGHAFVWNIRRPQRVQPARGSIIMAGSRYHRTVLNVEVFGWSALLWFVASSPDIISPRQGHKRVRLRRSDALICAFTLSDDMQG